MVEVSPGNISEFGKKMKDLADDWNAEYFPPVQVTKVKTDKPEQYPYYGKSFQAATEVQTAYDGVYEKMVPVIADVYEALAGLAEASHDIAEKYTTAEERGNAKVSAINKILTENMPDSQAGSPKDPTGQSGQPSR